MNYKPTQQGKFLQGGKTPILKNGGDQLTTIGFYLFSPHATQLFVR